MPLLINGEAIQIIQGPSVDNDTTWTFDIQATAQVELRLTELEQTDPAGRFRLLVNGDQLLLQRAASALWATATTIMTLDGATGALLGPLTIVRGADGVLTVTQNEDGASVQVAIFQGDRATPTDEDSAYISLRLSDSAGNQDEGVRIQWVATTVASGATQDSDLRLLVLNNNGLIEQIRLDGSTPRIELRPDGTMRLAYSQGAFAFQEATIISTTSDNDLTLDPGGQLLLAGGDVFQSSNGTEIGISVNSTTLAVGGLGSLIIPVKTDTGAPNDANMGDVNGAFGFNSFDNTLEVRDGTDTFLSVGVAGVVIQRKAPVIASLNGWYHPQQYLDGRAGYVDETRCIVCGEEMQLGDQIAMWANGRVRDDDLHAIFGHPHLERNSYITSLETRIAALEAAKVAA